MLDILDQANQFEGIIRGIAGDVEKELNDVSAVCTVYYHMVFYY